MTAGLDSVEPDRGADVEKAGQTGSHPAGVCPMAGENPHGKEKNHATDRKYFERRHNLAVESNRLRRFGQLRVSRYLLFLRVRCPNPFLGIPAQSWPARR
jgi:hypothetical protein